MKAEQLYRIWHDVFVYEVTVKFASTDTAKARADTVIAELKELLPKPAEPESELTQRVVL